MTTHDFLSSFILMLLLRSLSIHSLSAALSKCLLSCALFFTLFPVLLFAASFGSLAAESESAQSSSNQQKTPVESSSEPSEPSEPEAEESESYWEGEIGFIQGFRRQPLSSLDNSENGHMINSGLFSGGYYNGKFYIETNPLQGKILVLGYSAWESDDLQLNLIAEPYFTGFRAKQQQHGDLLTGIDKRKTSFDAGFELLSSADFGEIKFKFVSDISGVHKSYAAAVSYAYPLFFDKMVIWPSVGLSLIGDKATSYYYGIKAHEARADRAVYQAGSGVIVKWGVYGEYELSQRWTLLAFTRYSRFNSQISDSPLITRNSGLVIAMGATWRF
ncbi:MAG: outer membrane protein [Phenylobacterium sp.]|jgi:outer membrane protein